MSRHTLQLNAPILTGKQSVWLEAEPSALFLRLCLMAVQCNSTADKNIVSSDRGVGSDA
jgi:hypothetical protein